MNLSNQLQLVLTEGKHAGSHKFAFLRAILDYIVEKDPEEHRELKIPLVYFEEKFLLYYWMMSLHNTQQMITRQPLRYYEYIRIIINELRLPTVSIKTPETNNIHVIWDELKKRDILPPKIIKTLNRTRSIVFDHPVIHTKYISMCKDPYNLDFYNYIDERSTRTEAETYKDFYKYETTFIKVKRKYVSELKAMYYWFEKAVLLAWAEFTDNLPLNQREGMPTGLLLLQIPQPKRKNLKPFQDHFRKTIGVRYCVYCNEKKFNAIDHIIPWRMVKSDRFWNMLPICRSCNSAKSDRIWKLSAEGKKILKKSISKIVDRLEDQPEYLNQVKQHFIFVDERIPKKKSDLKKYLYDMTISKIASFSNL